MEYFDEKIAPTMRSILDWATLPVSRALRGMNPAHTVTRIGASKSY